MDQPSQKLALALRAESASGPEAQQSPFLNRELSWLEFNRRVLHQALDRRSPLLERVQFLSIFTSNLDEFYMKRVGGLRRQIATGVVTQSLDGRSPSEQLLAIRRTVLPMLRASRRTALNWRSVPRCATAVFTCWTGRRSRKKTACGPSGISTRTCSRCSRHWQ